MNAILPISKSGSEATWTGFVVNQDSSSSLIVTCSTLLHQSTGTAEITAADAAVEVISESSPDWFSLALLRTRNRLDASPLPLAVEEGKPRNVIVLGIASDLHNTYAFADAELLHILSTRFNLDELATLTVQTGVHYDDIAGNTRTERARELILYLRQRGQLDNLIHVGSETRPDIVWPAIHHSSKLKSTPILQLEGKFGPAIWLESTDSGINIRAWELHLDSASSMPPSFVGAPVLEPSGESVIGIVTSLRSTNSSGLVVSIEALWPELKSVTQQHTLPLTSSSVVVDAANKRSPTSSQDSSAIGIYIYNRSLKLQHYLCFSDNATVWHVVAQLKSSLNLPDRVSALDGQIGLAFSYSLEMEGVKLEEDQTLFMNRVIDGTMLALEVGVTQFGPEHRESKSHYRPAESGDLISDRMMGRLVREAFGHLMLPPKIDLVPLS